MFIFLHHSLKHNGMYLIYFKIVKIHSKFITHWLNITPGLDDILKHIQTILKYKLKKDIPHLLIINLFQKTSVQHI